MIWSPLRFYRESRSYTKGCYSDWHFWRMFPSALFRFYVICPVVDAFRSWRTRRSIIREERG